jgi:hypothetical protein
VGSPSAGFEILGVLREAFSFIITDRSPHNSEKTGTIGIERRLQMTDSFDRREFARRAALVSLGIGTVSDAEAVQVGTDPPSPNAPPERLRRPEKLLLDVLKQQYPSEHLTPDVLAEIEQDIASFLRRRRQLRAVPLDNGHAPFVFQAFRNDAPST